MTDCLDAIAEPLNAPGIAGMATVARKLSDMSGTPLGGLYALLRNRLRMVDPINHHDPLAIRFEDATDSSFETTFHNPEDHCTYRMTVERIGQVSQ